MEIKEVKNLPMAALSKERVKIGGKEFTRVDIKYYRQRAGKNFNDLDLYKAEEGPYVYTVADCDKALKLMDEVKEAQVWKAGDFLTLSLQVSSSVYELVKPQGKNMFGEPIWDFRAYYAGVPDVDTTHQGSFPVERFTKTTKPEAPRPPTKFKVGDRVRCRHTGHPQDENPFTIDGLQWNTATETQPSTWGYHRCGGKQNCKEGDLTLMRTTVEERLKALESSISDLHNRLRTVEQEIS